MYLDRAIDTVLLAWSQQEDRKPLVLRGARQTGKTAAVRQFGHRFELFLELNLERYEDRSLVVSCRSADELLLALRAKHNLDRLPERTLLFLDEIQESPEAITWLRFLYEDHPELFVVAAGSLLEPRLQQRGFSFPVGRVTFRTLRPFTFFEFLGATEHEVLAEHLRGSLAAQAPIPLAIHRQALDLLRDYLLVGGMPEAIGRWLTERSPETVRGVHRDLVQAMAEDIQKYGAQNVPYLEAAFENMRHHYGLRFRYENFAPGYRSQQMKDALAKLESARLLTRLWPTSSLELPLKIRPRSAPKLLPLDIGLALYTLGIPFQEIRAHEIERLLAGRVAEIFVGQQLLATQPAYPGELHFWVSESSRGNAELDYLLAGRLGPTPIEVKSGASGSLKSLHQFLWRAGLERGFRLYTGEYAAQRQQVKMPDGRLDFELISIPLYLAELLPTG